MKWFRNMKIAAKLLTGFIVVALVSAVVGAIGVYNIKGLDDSDTALYEEMTRPMGQLGMLSTSFQQMRVDLRDIIIADDPAVIAAKSSVITERRAEIETLSKRFGESITDDATADLFDKFLAARKTYATEVDKVMRLAKDNRDEEALALLAPEGTAGIAAMAEAEVIQAILDRKIADGKAKSDANTAQADAAAFFMLAVSATSFVLAILLGLLLNNAIGKPVRYLAQVANRMAEGDVDVRVKAKTKDEMGQLMDAFARMVSSVQAQATAARQIAAGDLDIDVAPRSEKDVMAIAMKTVIETLRSLDDEASRLTLAATEGKLDIRGDTEKFEGTFRAIIDGVNQTLDAVIGPLDMAADYVDRISRGDLPEKITADYRGDFNTIKNNLNTCIDAIGALVGDASRLADAARHGRLDIRAEVSGHSGDYARIVTGVNETLDVLIGYIDEMPAPVMIIDRDFSIQYMNRSGAAILGRSAEELIGSKCYDGFSTSHCRTGQCACAKAMENGEKVTAETDAHPQGRDLEITYTGMPVRNRDGAVIGAVELVVDQTAIRAAARLAEKQAQYQNREVGKLVGALEKIAVGDLDVRLEVGETDPDTEQIGRDFIRINGSLQQSIHALLEMMKDVDLLAKAALDGDLATRADAGAHLGDYRKIVEGVNMTLDAVVEPIREASFVLQEMEKGNLNVEVKGNYRGDHAVIKDALNSTISAIAGYIGEISGVLTAMAEGDLRQAITADYKGDFVAIKDSLNGIIGSLNDVLCDINEAADQVALGSRQVSDGSQALSQGATEQASSIQELTASITEIASQTRLNASNASNASALADEVRKNAADGNAQMQGMLTSMKEISDSSENISKIIKVIDDIAFQTNILALNAAVEAARAGQHGKGFAVVAEEVRNLAARSASAAKDTTELIEGSIDKVQAGTKIAVETAKALDRIVDGVGKAAALVGEIATASGEQAGGIAQINKGIEQVSQVVQTNSATAEESAAASEELSGQAELLKQQVLRFRLTDRRRLSEAAVRHALPESLENLMPRY